MSREPDIVGSPILRCRRSFLRVASDAAPAFVKICCRQGATVRVLVGSRPAGYEQIGSVAATISLLHLVSGCWMKKGPRMTRLRWSRFVAVAIVSWYWGAGRLAAQVPERAPSETTADLRREVTDLRLKLLESESQAEELEAEEKLLAATSPPGGETDGRPLSAQDDLWKQTVMGAAFSDNTQAGTPPVVEKLRNARELASAKRKRRWTHGGRRLKNAWRSGTRSPRLRPSWAVPGRPKMRNPRSPCACLRWERSRSWRAGAGDPMRGEIGFVGVSGRSAAGLAAAWLRRSRSPSGQFAAREPGRREIPAIPRRGHHRRLRPARARGAGGRARRAQETDRVAGSCQYGRTGSARQTAGRDSARPCDVSLEIE